EDGIRDFHVTGVQTCALPILAGVALAGVALVLHAWRWWIFLRAQELPVRFGRAAELTMIGNLFALISIGGIGGDAARILLLIRRAEGRRVGECGNSQWSPCRR